MATVGISLTIIIYFRLPNFKNSVLSVNNFKWHNLCLLQQGDDMIQKKSHCPYGKNKSWYVCKGILWFKGQSQQIKNVNLYTWLCIFQCVVWSPLMLELPDHHDLLSVYIISFLMLLIIMAYHLIAQERFPNSWNIEATSDSMESRNCSLLGWRSLSLTV